uniref:T-complex protein 1 subunit gamma n=1 Tax=Chinchilla lanigera TaxID=34839 RepID=A0A8C2VX25_CHILA
MMGHQPVLMLSQNTKHESGRKVQFGNINAANTIADIIQTCLGCKSMMKMLLDPIRGIVMTNSGNAILREIQVQHPAAKSMIEISQTQDEEVADRTTSVIILVGEMLSVAEHFLEHTPVDVNNHDMMLNIIINSSITTKAISRWSSLACNIALDAENGQTEIDIKKYAKVENIPGGIIEDSCVPCGFMINKDVTDSQMRHYIKNPRIVLQDSSLEYKKGEKELFAQTLQIEKEHIQQLWEDIIQLKPNMVITEKGISDLAQHYFLQANITAILRVRKTDNNRIARACGPQRVSPLEDMRKDDLGTVAGLLEIKKTGNECFTFITECKDSTPCTILLRGVSKEIFSKVEHNLQDAMQVCCIVLLDPQLGPGGGASKMAVVRHDGMEQWTDRAVAWAPEVIPRTLIQNYGASTICLLTSLRTKHTGRIDGIISGHKKKGDGQSCQGGAPDADQE